MTIEVNNKSGALAPRERIESLLAFVMNKLDLNPECDLNVTFVDDLEMTKLHLKWLNESGSTDVLSFPMDLPQSKNEIVTLGDIVISPDFATAQAIQAGHSPEHEMFILATHGLLHILGYDHAKPPEEQIMFELQESLVKQWSQESK